MNLIGNLSFQFLILSCYILHHSHLHFLVKYSLHFVYIRNKSDKFIQVEIKCFYFYFVTDGSCWSKARNYYGSMYKSSLILDLSSKQFLLSLFKCNICLIVLYIKHDENYEHWIRIWFLFLDCNIQSSLVFLK